MAAQRHEESAFFLLNRVDDDGNEKIWQGEGRSHDEDKENTRAHG